VFNPEHRKINLKICSPSPNPTGDTLIKDLLALFGKRVQKAQSKKVYTKRKAGNHEIFSHIIYYRFYKLSQGCTRAG